MSRTVVIGAGIIGLGIAWELIQRGEEVVIVDPRPPGDAASCGNTGWIVPILSAPIPAPGLPREVAQWMLRRDAPFRVDLTQVPKLGRWLFQFWRNCNHRTYVRSLKALGRLNAKSYHEFQRWKDTGLAFEWHRKGVLFVAEQAKYIEHLVSDAELLSSDGFIPAEWLTHPQVYAAEPALSPLPRSGVLALGEQHVRPESVISALAERLEQSGVEFVSAAVAEDVDPTGDRVTHLLAGNTLVQADSFVIATGAWVDQVARRFGVQLPVIAGKGYSITIDDPVQMIERPLYLADAKIACSPFDGSMRYAGMMELTGPDDRIDQRRLGAMVTALDRYLPGWNEGSERHVWAGLRSMTPDGLPLIGQIRPYENVYVAGGHGMLGVTMAPVTGRAIADLIVDGGTALPIEPLSPDRFRS